ncbi:MAG: Abi family protein [Prevotellaceae bacterium]|jgi:abortive infection bacteriophage resistance protein|nr:Abi family protein [Prevotellaceae bacterium]
MNNKPAFTIPNQIALLKQRGMIFNDEAQAYERLKNVSYYRLKGYWWDEQIDTSLHLLQPNTNFEDIMERYDFDRDIRLILFGGIEQIEIALRTKLIYHFSIAYGGLWYLDPALFKVDTKTVCGVKKTVHLRVVDELQKEFKRSKEIFIKDQQRRYPEQPVDAWKMLEVASMGVLSKLYTTLKDQLPEKATIANEMGINSPPIFTGWLEAIAYLRNMVAHHARLWSRTMIKRPSMQLNNPAGAWFAQPLKQGQLDKPFSTMSCMVYLCSFLSKSYEVRAKILELIRAHPSLPIYKFGFFNHWDSEPLWTQASFLPS